MIWYFLTLTFVFGQNCGYSACHPTKNGVINAHIVSHSHDDTGWLKTVDQYYYGAKEHIQEHGGVQYIIDRVTVFILSALFHI